MFLLKKDLLQVAYYFSPNSGEAAKTKFKIFCRNWRKIDIPVTYEFRYDNGIKRTVNYSYMAKPEFPLLYEGYEPESKPTILPAGDPERKYIIRFQIRIINVYRSYAEYSNVNIQVCKSHN